MVKSDVELLFGLPSIVVFDTTFSRIEIFAFL